MAQSILLMMAMITSLVFIHELGHYLAARAMGVHVEKFSIGFGKPIASFTDKVGTKWTIAPFLLGGYVKMKGDMVGGSLKDSDKNDFNSKNVFQRSFIVIAGPMANFLLAFILFVISGFVLSGIDYEPRVLDPEVGTPAYIAGIQNGDIITKINNESVSTWSDVVHAVSSYKEGGQSLNISVLRSHKAIAMSIKPELMDNRYIIGVKLDPSYAVYRKTNIKESLYFGYSRFISINKSIILWIKSAFSGNVSTKDLGSPIKIAELSDAAYIQGVMNWIFFVGVISINLAIMNMLPIPALDGGHLLFYIIEIITGKRVHGNFVAIMSFISFALLLSFSVYLIVRDSLEIYFK